MGQWLVVSEAPNLLRNNRLVTRAEGGEGIHDGQYLPAKLGEAVLDR